MKLKRGYENGVQTIEILDGHVDVVVYQAKDNGSFYFYRFSPLHVFGERISKDLYLVSKKSVEDFLAKHDRDYDVTLIELLEYATEHGMNQRYDM